jgi:hypothetical protein
VTRMRHEVVIARPPEQVLAYAASARRWPEWHPSSLSVVGPDGPLPTGASFEEDIRAGGREGHLTWDVAAYEEGVRWHAWARGTHGLSLDLVYEVFAAPGGTRFVRTLLYAFPGLGMRLANALVLSRRIDRESAASLAILREVIERG